MQKIARTFQVFQAPQVASGAVVAKSHAWVLKECNCWFPRTLYELVAFACQAWGGIDGSFTESII